ncbi:MAG: hypothetical protein PWP08_1786 [Methanofollis sp.]|nr:hypothetical protein [Methanofollis sp.]
MENGFTRRGGLGIVAAVAFAVGNMVGAGVFVLSGLVVQTAGPSAVISYLICGGLVALTGLSYASLASIYPEDGGGYLYSRRMLGAFPGFLTGWGMYISVTIASAFVLLSLGIYVNLLFGTSFDIRIAAGAGALALAIVNLRSVAEAGKAEIVLVALKVSILAGFAAIGIAMATPADFSPLFPHGASGMFSGVVMVFFAYIGFQVVAMMGGEIKRSERNVPLATLLSIGIVALIYTGVEIGLLAARLPAYGETSLFDAAVVFFGEGGGLIIAAGAIFSTLSAANANLIGGSRVALEMASERQIPGWFARLRNDQPRNAILLSTGIVLVLITFGSLGVIVDLTNTVALVAMGLVNASAGVLAIKRGTVPENRRYFRLPFGPLIPAAGAASCVLMILTLPVPTLLAGLGALAAGTILYVLEDTPRGERAVGEIRTLLGRDGR